MTPARAAVAALLVLAALVTGACSTVDGQGLVGETRAPPAVVVDIDAPDALRDLLREHLDLARLPALAPGEAVGEQELDRLVAATPAQVRSLLETEGYFEPTVEVARASVGADGVPKVTVRVEPGARVRIGSVTIDVQGELDALARSGDVPAQATLRALVDEWPLPVGKPFRNDDWSGAKTSTLVRLQRDGYLGATWSGTGAQVDVAAGTAKLFAIADSGPLFRTGELRIEGLQRYGEAPVRHLAGFRRSTPATEELLLDYQDRLVESGLFATAVVAVGADAEDPAAAPVLVRVRERPLNEATVGVGFSTNVGPRASLDLKNREVFELPLAAHNAFEVTEKRQSWNGEVSTYPGRGFWRELVGGSFTREVSDADVVTTWSARVGRSQHTKPIDRLIFAEITQSTTTTDFDPRSDRPPSRAATAVSANYHYVWRRLDDVILPTRGLSMSLQGGAGYAFSDFASNGPFARLYGRFTGYHPLPGGFFGQARIEIGDVVRRDDAIQVPEALLFRPGGENSVRGYAYRSLGPVVDGAVVGGAVMFTGSVEIARPLSENLPAFWWAVFVDAGRAAFQWNDLRPAVGAGVGLRWRSPVGPLAIDIAHGDEVNAWRTHLSVGVVF